MAVYFLQEGISPQDTEKIRLAAQNADVSICYEDGIQQVYLNGSNAVSYTHLTNFLLMHAMGPNVAGVIGTAVAAGTFMAIFGVK